MSLKTAEREALLVCECRSLDHLISLSYWPPEDGSSSAVYFTFHLITWKGFWRRLWQGLRYAFGAKQRYGAWDEVILSPEDAARMIEVLKPHAALVEKKS